MAGMVVLAGGAEFGGRMADVDRQALAHAGGAHAPVAIIPTAAALDNNAERAGSNGVRWFQGLGATHVQSLPIIDKASANDPENARKLAEAKLIYILGGFPRYLAETLADSLCWRACLEAADAGAAIAGSSAGAMVVCDVYHDPYSNTNLPGLGLVTHACVLPHHNTSGHKWARSLATALPDTLLLGIDERTAMIRALPVIETEPSRTWQVYGQGAVTVYDRGVPTIYTSPQTFRLENPHSGLL